MVDTVTIRVSGPLRRFIDQRAGDGGLYESASEYLRDLIRHDFEKEDNRKWTALADELKPALNAKQSEFVPFDAQSIIKDAKARHGAKK